MKYLLTIAVVCLLVGACSEKTGESAATASFNSRGAVVGLLSEESAETTERKGGVVATLNQFARAYETRDFHFPQDHAPHPDYQTEWWYLTANLRDQYGADHGVQFTIFRRALAPARDMEASGSAALAMLAPTSPWRTRQIYMAHAALTDVAENRHQHSQRMARGAQGLAGYVDGQVFVADWSLAVTDGGATSSENSGVADRISVSAVSRYFSISLRGESLRPIALQGVDGLSAKGPGRGNASFYYSYPRIALQGTLHVDRGQGGSRVLEVQGLGWLDREWSTSVLPAGTRGWDWLALHLDDGSDLMLYRLRADGAAATDFDYAACFTADGQRLLLGPVSWTPLRWFEDQRGSRWPTRWRLQIPQLGEVLISAPVQDQLMDMGLSYWEGYVQVHGAVSGQGYLEMTGY